MTTKTKNRLVVLGAGESGFGTAVLAQKQGWEVFVSDRGEIKPKYAQMLKKHKIEFESGKHTETLIMNADEVMKSPGIPDTAPLVKQLCEQGIPVISEIEFASRYTTAKIVGITGSNGKTTTTSLTYHVLKQGGLNVAMAGNIGQSFAYQVATDDKEVYVLELSSFQLDGIVNFRPHVAVLTNITPDHLDRYDYNFSNYVASKFRIGMNQTAEDYFIYCADDPGIMDHIKEYRNYATALPFSYGPIEGDGGYVEDSEIGIRYKKKLLTMSIQELGLQGRHNAYNSMAAGIVAQVFNLRKDTIRDSLSDFKALEHRLEFVAKIGGIDFINDSKATNINSTWYALESIDKPIVWIAGGVDKGNDYEVLTPLVRKKVKAIICMGVDNRSLHEAFSRNVDVMVNTTNMTDAVRMAQHLSDKGDVVLLSPACASFDLFENYEDRGNQFKNAVRRL